MQNIQDPLQHKLRVLPLVEMMESHNWRDQNEDEVRPEFYTVSQLAELLQLTEMTIYRMVAREELPCYLIGRVKRFRHSDIEAFLEQCRVPSMRERDGSTRQTRRRRLPLITEDPHSFSMT